MTAPSSPGPETLPVVYVHHGPQGDLVYCDQPVLVVHVDEAMAHDRNFVRVAFPLPDDLLQGPVSFTDKGGPEAETRKGRVAEWLRARIAALADRKPVSEPLQ